MREVLSEYDKDIRQALFMEAQERLEEAWKGERPYLMLSKGEGTKYDCHASNGPERTSAILIDAMKSNDFLRDAIMDAAFDFAFETSWENEGEAPDNLDELFKCKRKPELHCRTCWGHHVTPAGTRFGFCSDCGHFVRYSKREDQE
jgi:hypothetical protein